jgi:RecJ-like exonuclease
MTNKTNQGREMHDGWICNECGSIITGIEVVTSPAICPICDMNYGFTQFYLQSAIPQQPPQELEGEEGERDCMFCKGKGKVKIVTLPDAPEGKETV